jgi:hypothetical protein
MVEADKLLQDEELIDVVYEAQGERHRQSAMRGRWQTPAEMVLRLLLLKHVRNWSFDTLEREVKMNLAIVISHASGWAKCRMPKRWLASRRPWAAR